MIFRQQSADMPESGAMEWSGTCVGTESEPVCMNRRKYRIMSMNRKGVLLKAGMTLAIEPMINIGGLGSGLARTMTGQ